MERGRGRQNLIWEKSEKKDKIGISSREVAEPEILDREVGEGRGHGCGLY